MTLDRLEIRALGHSPTKAPWGEPTPRWTAVQKAIGQIGSLAAHLPVSCPQAEMAIGYSAPSLDVFFFAGQDRLFERQLRGLYRALWPHSVPMDIVSPSMDWSKYKLVYLPNFAALDEVAMGRIREVLTDRSGPKLIVDGHFGSFTGKGDWSFRPPEGLDDLVDARVVDFDRVTEMDIRGGRNILKTEFGEYPISRPCQYAVAGDWKPLAPNGIWDSQRLRREEAIGRARLLLSRGSEPVFRARQEPRRLALPASRNRDILIKTWVTLANWLEAHRHARVGVRLRIDGYHPATAD